MRKVKMIEGNGEEIWRRRRRDGDRLGHGGRGEMGHWETSAAGSWVVACFTLKAEVPPG